MDLPPGRAGMRAKLTIVPRDCRTGAVPRIFPIQLSDRGYVSRPSSRAVRNRADGGGEQIVDIGVSPTRRRTAPTIIFTVRSGLDRASGFPRRVQATVKTRGVRVWSSRLSSARPRMSAGWATESRGSSTSWPTSATPAEPAPPMPSASPPAQL